MNRREAIQIDNNNERFRNRRERQAEQPPGKIFRASGLAVVLCILAMTGIAVDFVLQPGRFPMKHITVEGDLQNAQPNQVRQAISKAVVSSNILSIDIAKAAAAAQELPWVENVQIERQWPDTLVVYVNERIIRSRWNDDLWLDQLGNPVELVGFRDTSLPHLKGQPGSEQQVLAQYQSWQTLFKPYGLSIAGLNKSGTDSWEIVITEISRLPNDSTGDSELPPENAYFSLYLGNVQPQLKIERFIELYTGSFKPVSSQIRRIDMRYQDGISIQWKDEQPQQFSGLIKETKS